MAANALPKAPELLKRFPKCSSLFLRWTLPHAKTEPTGVEVRAQLTHLALSGPHISLSPSASLIACLSLLCLKAGEGKARSPFISVFPLLLRLLLQGHQILPYRKLYLQVPSRLRQLQKGLPMYV